MHSLDATLDEPSTSSMSLTTRTQDGRRAARLHDEEEEEISLEEARQTAERLGLPIPSPLPSASEGEEIF